MRNISSCKRCIIITLLLFIVGESLAVMHEEKTLSPERIFQIKQGINLNEWLEKDILDSVRMDTLITYEKIDLIKQWGFDHVRIPVSEDVLLDDRMEYRPNVLKVLLDRIDYCKSVGLKVILDLHKTRNHKFGNENNELFFSEKARERFIQVWGKLQEIFSRYPNDFLAYECLNEPAAPINKHFLWNDVLNEWIKFIRKKEPERFLFIGPNRGNQIWTLKYMKFPKNDSNLILTIHYYTPGLFTHYKATWSKHAFYQGPVHYPGETLTKDEYEQLPDSLKGRYKYTRTFYDKKFISGEIKKAIKIAQSNKMQLNLGEFGCRRTVPDSSRYQWFKDVADVMKENGISYTLWGMNGSGFGLWDEDHKLDTLMINSLKWGKKL